MAADPTGSLSLALVAAVFLLAGFAKGVVGFGLPTISLALLAAIFGLKPAMALMIAPSFATNVVQGVIGGHLGPVLRRLWPLYLAAAIGTVIGAQWLHLFDDALLSLALGCLVAVYALLALLAGVLPPPGAARERWAGPGAGLVTGIVTGLTGSSVMPAVPYLQAIGLTRDQLIQAMGVLFATTAAALAVGLAEVRLFSPDLGLASLAGLPTAFIGMWLGQKVRHRLPEARFKRVFLASLTLLGLYIILDALRQFAV